MSGQSLHAAMATEADAEADAAAAAAAAASLGLVPSAFHGLTRTLATLFPREVAPSVSGDPLLSLRNVWKQLGGEQVLAGVSFDIRDRIVVGRRMGQVVGLLGPSGIGKTTLLRIIAGLDRPDQGVVSGHFGSALPRGSVGMVFQEARLIRHRTVLNNLKLAGRILGLRTDEAQVRARDLLDRFRVAHRANAYPAELSGGERQRAAIAQQLMAPRSIVVMDEPFSGLDPTALEQARSVIVEAADADDSNTILLVTHDIPSAIATADRLLVLGRCPGRSGAEIRASFDLVEQGYCAAGTREPTGDRRALERELRRLFREL